MDFSNHLQTDQYSTLFKDIPLSYDILQKIECDLELYEKVSLVFLLYDDIPVSQERLYLAIEAFSVESSTNNVYMNLLHDWAVNYGKYWREKLIEALLIIQAFKNVKMLGLDLAAMNDHFLPKYPQSSLFIHPLKKALYSICEELTTSDSESIIYSITSEAHGCVIRTDSKDSKYFELFLLKLIKAQYITLGSWDRQKKSAEADKHFIQTNITSFALCLKKLGFHKLHNILISSQEELNSKAMRINSSLQYSCSKTLLPGINKQNESQIDFTLLDKKPLITNDKNNCNLTLGTGSFQESLNDKYYIKNPKETGIVYIINEKNYQCSNKNLEDREGSDIDKEALMNTWKKYGFKIIDEDDLPAEDILKTIKSCAKDFFMKHYHSVFVLCIMSHGSRGEIIAVDGKSVSIESIEETLYTSEAPQLANIPKIIIIQSCQGQKFMKTVDVSSTAKKNNTVSTLKTDSPCPEKCDMLLYYATVPNFVSYRDTNYGTWFIQILCKHLNKNFDVSNPQHFGDICTNVNNELTKKRDGDRTQVSEWKSSFTKKLYLPIL